MRHLVPQTVGKDFFIWIVFILLLSTRLDAQGDGPKSHLLAPKGIWGVNPKYLNLDQNMVPAGNILVQDADIKVDVFPTTFFHTMEVGGRFAQLLFMVNPGTANGSIDSDTTVLDRSIKTNGFSDGFVGFKLGLIGAPALNISEFAKHEPQFSLYGYFRVWYSGSYDPNKLLNLGTNRLAIELGAPMSVPLSFGGTKGVTWLEVFPSIQFYTDNNDPARSSRADKTEQRPLLLIENHLTHNITKKFWVGADLRFQYGGRTVVDEVEDDNRIEAIGGGISLGYQFLPPLSGYLSYGGVLTGDGNADAEMLRLSLVVTYMNLKKDTALKN